MVFIGVGGALEGKVNPDLMVKPGDDARNHPGERRCHSTRCGEPDFWVGSERISQRASETKVGFKALQQGTFTYFCSLPGHRQAGMEGKLVVGNPVASVEKTLPSVVRPPDDLPAALRRSAPATVRVDLTTTEVLARSADGTSYTYWTFNGKVPGPFLRVRLGDTVEVHLKNATGSVMPHSVDFHAVTGPGGGAVATQTNPGEETSFTFKALNAGVYVYHCATAMVAHHITNGMYGLILVEPEGGLPPVDREIHVMQGGTVHRTGPGGEG